MPQHRLLSIELLKFLAVVIVYNSHCEPLYGEYSFLATGGAIGDCLFFFVSGYTLFLGRYDRFDNWYKRRIRRIFPSVISWVIISSAFFDSSVSLFNLLKGSGWFISCIMIYYIVLYFVKRWSEHKPLVPLIISIVIILIYYLNEDTSTFFMYGETFFKWVHYFLFMLLGAYMGNGTIHFVSHFKRDFILFIFSVILFYLIMIGATKTELISHFQLLSLIPLLSIVISMYNLCNCHFSEVLMNKRLGNYLCIISSLCLEIYIVQGFCIRDILSNLFPFNIIILFLFIVFVAYVTRLFGRLLLQLFQNDDFDWKALVRLRY